MSDELSPYLQAGPCVDSDTPEIVALARSLTSDDNSDIENAVALYYYVRDSIRYNPYALGRSREDWRASHTLAAGEGWCVPKAILLAALCRAASIPARLGYADVVNHLSTERMRERMKTDIFYYHGYCSILLQGRWVKSTPAFNLSLCEKFGLKPLEFDGVNDSLYHEFDQTGNRHMEYIRDRGEYAEVPYDEILAVFREQYPHMFEQEAGKEHIDTLEASQWEADVERETSR